MLKRPSMVAIDIIVSVDVAHPRRCFAHAFHDLIRDITCLASAPVSFGEVDREGVLFFNCCRLNHRRPV